MRNNKPFIRMPSGICCKISPNGDKHWFLNDEFGEMHREDGPAIERVNGDKMWFLNGEIHREDGPAIDYAHGTKEWFLKGERHREDGPAIERANGAKEWWLNDKEATAIEVFKQANDEQRKHMLCFYASEFST